MLFDYTLDDLITFAIYAVILLTVINIVVVSDSSTRYYLTDKKGDTSKTIFTRGTLHLPDESFALHFKLFLNGVTGGLAAVAFAAIVTGTIRGNVGDLDKGGVAHILFIWFTFSQIMRVTTEQYVLKTVMNVKPRVVKIDGNQHYISTVEKLPWLLANRITTSLAALAICTFFVKLF